MIITDDQHRSIHDLIATEARSLHANEMARRFHAARPLDLEEVAGLAARFAPTMPQLTAIEAAIAARCGLELNAGALVRGDL